MGKLQKSFKSGELEYSDYMARMTILLKKANDDSKKAIDSNTLK